MRVGTSGAGVLKDRLRKDHPHACGDKKNYQKKKERIIGSSPCVWGQVRISASISDHCRIIPMRVGTSIYADTDSIHCEDHPHACGDKFTGRRMGLRA